MNDLREMLYLSLLVASALILSIVESLLPSLSMIPMAKLGLANIVILVTIVCFGFNNALWVSILKSIILILVTGNLISFLYSLPAGIFSCIAMNYVYKQFSIKYKVFSLVGVSIIGALIHNITQIIVASLVLNSKQIYMYLPMMWLMSIATGYFIGLASTFTSEKLIKIVNSREG